jgi:predicted MPP superfamily phosphohydrolase
MVASAATAAAGLGLTYAAGYEVRAFRLRRVEVPVLAPGAAPLRVLHLSDLHLTPDQHRKRAFVRELANLEPDLVVDTGDNIAHAAAIPVLLDALGPLLARPGVFVFGSNDYYGPTPKNPARYLAPVGRSRRIVGRGLPVGELRDGLASKGWVDLGNARTVLEVGDRRIELVGTDDPHIGRDRYDAVAGRAGTDVDLALGVVHAPYHRVVDRMVSDGCSLVLAGHTHGGQLCLPGVGALVTNCDLDRRRAKGLSRHVVATPDGTSTGWLHVSAGLGTSPYAPVRFACPPEATLLTLVPAP